METMLIFSPFPSPSTYLRPRSVLCSAVSPHNNSNNGGGGGGGSGSNGGKSKEANPPTSLNIRYRARSRRQQAKQEKEKKQQEGEAKPTKKRWEEMGASEKALEVYLGEKGILFWLNKLAYASIFLVIGGWILFRFVGPSLGLYQLDSPPLSPTSIFNSPSS